MPAPSSAAWPRRSTRPRSAGPPPQAALDEVADAAGGLDAGEEDLDAAHERAEKQPGRRPGHRLTLLQGQEREADRERAAWTARRDALALGLARKDGAGASCSPPGTGPSPGCWARVASLVTVSPGDEAVVAAALGAVADALAVASPDGAAAALVLLRDGEPPGQAGLLVAGGSYADDDPWPDLPAGARWVLDLVTAPEPLRPALTRHLRLVAAVGTARRRPPRWWPRTPRSAASPPAGDPLGRDWAQGGSSDAPSLLEVQAAVDEAPGAGRRRRPHRASGSGSPWSPRARSSSAATTT